MNVQEPIPEGETGGQTGRAKKELVSISTEYEGRKNPGSHEIKQSRRLDQVP